MGVSFNIYYGCYLLINGVVFLIFHGVVLASIYLFRIEAFLVTPAFITIAVFFILMMPGYLLYASVLSFIFDKTEAAMEFFTSLTSILTMASFSIVAVIDMIYQGDSGTILHYMFTILLPLYMPPGIFYYINKIYVTCSLKHDCSSLTTSSYMTHQIIIMFVMAVINIPLYYMFMRILDNMKNGGSIRSAIFMEVSYYIVSSCYFEKYLI